MRRAQRRRHLVQIHNPAESQASSGEVTLSFTVDSEEWAAVEPLRSDELLTAAAIDAAATHRVVMPYNPDLTHRSRIVHRGRTLEVLTIVNVDDRNITHELLCREDVS